MFDANDLELLSAYLDDALTAGERAALEARLEAEADLRRELARLRATVDLIGTLPALRAPRDFRLMPHMVRRPSIVTSAAFSAMSAAAAVVLLVIGAALFTVRAPQAPPAAAELAFAPTILPLTASTGRDDTASAASESANAAEETDLKSEAAPVTDGLFLALPTGTPLATIQPPMLYAEQETQTEDNFSTLDMQADAAVQQSQDDQLRYASEQPAPSSAAGGAAAQAPLPQPTIAPTEKPSLTPSPVPTATPAPSATPTATASLMPTPTATPLPLRDAAPSGLDGSQVVGLGLIAVALILFALALVTMLRRRA